MSVAWKLAATCALVLFGARHLANVAYEKSYQTEMDVFLNIALVALVIGFPALLYAIWTT